MTPCGPNAVGTYQLQPIDAVGVSEMHILGDAVRRDNMDQPEGVGKGALAPFSRAS